MTQLILDIGIVMGIAGVNRLAFIYLINRRFHLSFVKNPMFILFYFLAVTTLLLSLFPKEAATLYGDPPLSAVFFMLFALLVINPWIYRRINHTHHAPKWLSEANPDQQFLKIDTQYLFSKTGDVIFQQTAIGIVLLHLVTLGIPLEDIVIIFAGLFALGHVHMFFSSRLAWGLYFTLFAALAGFALPFIILGVPGGIYYAIALHMFWYVASGAFFGILLSDLTHLSITRRVKRETT